MWNKDGLSDHSSVVFSTFVQITSCVPVPYSPFLGVRSQFSINVHSHIFFIPRVNGEIGETNSEFVVGFEVGEGLLSSGSFSKNTISS